MDSFLDLAKSRFSSRKYLQKPVEEEKILKVIEAARIAPSAANKQPWIFYVFKSDDSRLKVCEAYHRDWLKSAPVVIVACADHRSAWIRSDGKDHCDIDLAIAIDHITLQATSLGLSTCWICNFDTAKLKSILSLPDFIEPIAMLPLAYPAETADVNRHSNGRKKLEDILIWK